MDERLEKERNRRLEIEESMDELRREVGWQREHAARTAHTVGKIVHSELQSSERQDQIIVYLVKKKAEQCHPSMQFSGVV